MTAVSKSKPGKWLLVLRWVTLLAFLCPHSLGGTARRTEILAGVPWPWLGMQLHHTVDVLSGATVSRIQEVSIVWFAAAFDMVLWGGLFIFLSVSAKRLSNG